MIFNRQLGVFLLALLLGAGARESRAAGKGKAAAATEQSPNNAVLDFENDVIEGQRKKPDLFMQTGSQNLTLDAILFLRNDFNDFQQIERNRKPGYFEKKGK